MIWAEACRLFFYGIEDNWGERIRWTEKEIHKDRMPCKFSLEKCNSKILLAAVKLSHGACCASLKTLCMAASAVNVENYLGFSFGRKDREVPFRMLESSARWTLKAICAGVA
jgi:hypothetical protein